jgi:diamine N-acetyltransferase
MNIRTANTIDIDKILLLEEKIFNFHLNARPDWVDEKKRLFTYEFMKKTIESKTGKIFIAEDDRKIIAYCIVNLKEIKNHQVFLDMVNIEIEDIYVDEQYRKKGVGNKLFTEVKKYAKEEGVKFIELSVWGFNKNAINFYEHLGMNIRICRMELKI